MPIRRFAARALAAVASFVGLNCAKAPPGRYALEVDPGARLRTEYVRDRVSRRWAYREFEVRVDTTRALPEPLRHPDYGDALSIQLFKPGSAQTGGLRSIVPRIDDRYRVWSGADMIGRPDVEGRVGYGVAVKWYRDGAETRYEPMEVFPLPPVGDAEPEEWSPWFSAATLRPGAFGWWAEVHGTPVDSIPKPDLPFELRWRTMLTDVAGLVP